MISDENPNSIGWNGVEIQLIEEIQISHHMTIYGQNLGGFKRGNNECIRNREKVKLHKIKIVFFFVSHIWCYDAYLSRITSLWRKNAVIRDEIRVIAPHMLSQNNYNFDLMQRMHSLFARLKPLNLTTYGHVAGNWISLIICNFTPFQPIETGFSL